MTLEEMRSALVEEIETHSDALNFHQRHLAVAEAALAAHDAAVEAARQEHPPASPDNAVVPTARAARRNVADEVYRLLEDKPHTAKSLAVAIGGVRESQIVNALIRLGDKVSFDGQFYARSDSGVMML